ncbi:MAG: DUF4920 domain-containing protein [Polyangiaceae bacterium]
MQWSRLVLGFSFMVAPSALGCSRPELAEPDPAKPRTETAAQPAAARGAGGAVTTACGAAKAAKTYGEKPKGEAPLLVTKVLDDPDGFEGKEILATGRVRAACTAKGCWMELAPSMEKEAPGSRVTFKDYGFFVPTTSAGKVACVEGRVMTKRVSPDEVKHLEGEGTRFAKKMPDGSAREVRIVATGVELSDPS